LSKGKGAQEEIHSHLQQAEETLKSGDAPVAEQEFRAVIALDTNNSEARAKLGFVLFMRGDWTGASKQFQQVLKAQPHLTNAQVVLGMCQKRLGRPVEARRLLEEAVPHLPAGALQTQAGLELAEILYQSDDLGRAVDVIRILLPSNPKNVDVL
jgi:Tfp pilus assembly protein PilF